MALFTDGGISSIEDLSGQDSQLLNVANVEGIDVTRKLGLAQEELSLEIKGLLARVSGWTSPGCIGLATLPGLTNGSRGIRNVVVTPALKLWHTYRALDLVYRDAYNSQLNDRYGGKRDEYRAMAVWAYEKVVQSGIGIVWNPIEKAATPKVQAAAGGAPDGDYYVAVAWTSGAETEGASSLPESILVSGSSFRVVPAEAPSRATGWNVFVGTNLNALVRQNVSPLATDQSWLQPDVQLTAGRMAGTGQEPDYLQPVPRVIQRG
jgi:hypothetical protein